MTMWQPPLSDAEWARLQRHARRVNAERDAGERAFGWAAPGDCGVWMHLRTAMQAFEAGIRTRDLSCLMEGYAMLECIEREICPPDFRAPEKGGGDE